MQPLAPPEASNRTAKAITLQQTGIVRTTDTEDDVNATHADTTVREPRIK